MTATTPSTAQQRPADEKKRYLVVVDGNPAELFSTGMILQRLDYTIFTATTAEDGLHFVQNATPAAIITELLLPRMSGTDLLNRVKQDPRTKNIPVIIHTRMKDPKVEELCLVAGCASFIRKPVDPNTLYRTVQYALEATPRNYIRLKTCLKVMIGDEGKGPAARNEYEYITALSENGIYVRTDHCRAVNSKLPLTIVLADRMLQVRAVVLYCVAGTGGPLKEPGMGMKFVEISESDREFIRKFIKDEVMKGLV